MANAQLTVALVASTLLLLTACDRRGADGTTVVPAASRDSPDTADGGENVERRRARLLKAEAALLASSPTELSAASHLGRVTDSVQSRAELGMPPSYEVLRHGVRALRALPPPQHDQLQTQAIQVSLGFHNLGLIARAQETLALNPPARDSPLGRTLARLIRATRGVDRLYAGTQPTQASIYEDILYAGPHLTPASLGDLEDGLHEHYPLPSTEALTPAGLTEDERPLLSVRQTDSADAVGGEGTATTALLEIALSAAETAELDTLAAAVGEADWSDRIARSSLVARLSRDIAAAWQRETADAPDEFLLIRAERGPTGLLLQWEALGGRWDAAHYAWLLASTRREEPAILALTFWDSGRLVPLDEESAPAALISSVGGSGAFFSAFLLAAGQARALWSIDGVPRGSVTFAQLDSDAKREILLSAATTQGFEDCGQCARRLSVSLYDWDATAGRYLQRASRRSVTDQNKQTSHARFGMQTSMLEEAAASHTAVRDPVAAIRALPEGELTREQLAPIWQRLMARREMQLDNDLFDVLASESREISNLLRHRPANELTSGIAISMALEQIGALALGGRNEAALAAAEDPWLLRSVRANPLFEGDLAMRRSVIHLNLGQYEKAFPLLNQAHAANLPGAGETAGNLAWYYNLTEESRSAYRHALLALERNAASGGRELAVNLYLAAWAASGLADSEATLDWCLRAVRSARAAAEPGIAAAALALASDLALSDGFPELALRLLDEALIAVDQATWQSQGPGLLYRYGKAMLRAGDRERGLELLAAAATVAAESGSTAALALLELSRAATESGEDAAARAYAVRAFEAVVSARRAIGIEQHKFSYVRARADVSGWLFSLLRRQQTDPQELWHYLERWKLQVFLDLYASDPATAGRDDGARALQAYVEAADAAEATVDYLFDADTSIAIVFDGASRATRVVNLPLQASDVAAAVARARKWFNLHERAAIQAIREDVVPPEMHQALADLYRMLIAPLELPATAKRLIVAPDGALFGVPWPALVDGQGRWLDLEVAEIPSVLAVRDPSARSSPKRALIVSRSSAISPAVYSTATGESAVRGLPALRGAYAEAKDVGRLLSGWQVEHLTDSPPAFAGRGGFADPQAVGIANLPRLRASAAEADLIHIAAHGFFNARAPMRSVLFVPDGKEREYVTAEDLLTLDLRASALVVLSACQTALRGSAPGAEPIGLTRALFARGARQVIATSWSVDDATTREFFGHFYRQLLAGRPTSEALQAAQNAIRAEHEHPYFWAGVTLHGRP